MDCEEVPSKPSNGCMASEEIHYDPGSPTMYKKSSYLRKTASALLAIIIALTAAVPFLQPGHRKSINRRNFSLIVERTQTRLRKELDHGIISFNFAHRNNLRHS